MKPVMHRSIAIAALVLVLGACSANEGQQASAPVVQPATPASQPAPAPAVDKALQVAEQTGEQISAAAHETAEVMKQSAEALKQRAMAARQVSESLAAAQAAAMAPAPVPAVKKPAAVQPANLPAAALKPGAAPEVKLPANEQKIAENIVSQASDVVASGDMARGQKIARKCAACHSFDDKGKLGPGLGGVFNREAGTVSGFSYTFSKFIQPGKAWSWDASHLAAWICDSADAVRNFTGDASAKTKMANQRICDAAQQADLIAYLKTL